MCTFLYKPLPSDAVMQFCNHIKTGIPISHAFAGKNWSSKVSFGGLMLHLLYEVQPAVVDVILGEGGHRLQSLPQRQVAVVGLTDHKVVQLLWRGVMILNLDM